MTEPKNDPWDYHFYFNHRKREADRYQLKKAQQVRQTRTSLMATNSETPQKKRRKDMTEDERRAHDSAN